MPSLAPYFKSETCLQPLIAMHLHLKLYKVHEVYNQNAN